MKKLICWKTFSFSRTLCRFSAGLTPVKLDYDYVPKDLVHREGQMHSLETLFRPLAQHGRPCTAYLTGSVGTGKTVTARRFCTDMAEYCRNAGRPISVVFINCRNRSSESAVVLQLIRHFDAGFPDRGFAPDEMLRVLRNHLTTNVSNMVVVLDEVDALMKKNKLTGAEMEELLKE